MEVGRDWARREGKAEVVFAARDIEEGDGDLIFCLFFSVLEKKSDCFDLYCSGRCCSTQSRLVCLLADINNKECYR